MTPEIGRTLLEILRKRETLATDVHLVDGRVCRVFNIAWGYDLGDEYAHVTTNISPASAGRPEDFFFMNEVSSLVDAETGSVLFEVSSR